MGVGIAPTNLLVALLLTALRTCKALSPPDCGRKDGQVCSGYASNVLGGGESAEAALAEINSRFCGCTHVTGNIQLDFSNVALDPSNEDFFNAFYHLEVLEGFLRLQHIPSLDRLILPNLRLVRGEELLPTAEGYQLAIVLFNSSVGELVLPELREVSRGDVMFRDTGHDMCNYKSVNWKDIIDGGELVEIGNTCDVNSGAILSCAGCADGHCWSETPLTCQSLNKTICSSCGLDRCHDADPSPTSTVLQCCNPLCAAGCYGGTPDTCYACEKFDNNGTCVSQCPPELTYDPDRFALVPNPDHRLSAGSLCVERCPDNLYQFKGVCVEVCPEGFYLPSNSRICEECRGICPKTCPGLTNDEIVDRTNIHQLNQSCTIIDGGLNFGPPAQTGFSVDMLEVLSTVEEVRGQVRIQQWTDLVSFPYLRNMRRLGAEGGTNFSLPCSGVRHEYSLVIGLNPNLVSVDFSSLEAIVGGGYVLFGNPQLCYVGNLSLYMSDEEHVCTNAEARKDPQTCINESLRCHDECDSDSCWGPEDHQCDGCDNYRYGQRCVPDCASVTLPTNSSGLYQNSSSLECQECDEQCIGGCSIGTGPTHCLVCRTYHILSTSGERLCVASCPPMFYLEPTLARCIPCHKACEGGCHGNLPYVDLERGCVSCSRVELNSTGGQVRCLTSACLKGTYRSFLDPSLHSLPSHPSISLLPLLSLLSMDTELCLPCHQLCADCALFGITTAECFECSLARSNGTCVESCDPSTEFLDLNKVCMRCSGVCDGCYGTGRTDCLQCAAGHYIDYLSDQRTDFECREECGVGEYPSEEGVCEDCHLLCANCAGPGPANCTQCKNSQFQEVLVEQNGTALLVHCFDCTQEQELVNGTCQGGGARLTGGQGSLSGVVLASIVLGVVLVGSVVIVLLAMSFYIYKRSLLTSPKITDADDSWRNPIYGDMELMPLKGFDETLQPPLVPPSQARLVVTPEDCLSFGQELGSGAFGTVYEGYWQPEGSSQRYHVAIKILNETTSSSSTASRELLQEGVVMATVDHPNVVRLYCVCLGQRMMLVTQFVPLGALLDYLKKKKEFLNARTMLLFSLQIAEGMAYLEAKRMVHRDLAARNVLVQAPDRVKITDFGLTRIIEVGESHYTAKGGKVPLRWMAPESIATKVYTHKSDVWSFAVTVWEVLTFGSRPYQGKTAREVLALLESGQRLEQPATCTVQLYGVLLECWLLEPDSRPPFPDLASRLEGMLQDPLRYILTTTDGCMSSYGNLPSNLLMSGESVYENFSVPLPYLSPDNNYDNKTPSTSDYDNHTSMDAGPSSNVYDNTAITDSLTNKSWKQISSVSDYEQPHPQSEGGVSGDKRYIQTSVYTNQSAARDQPHPPEASEGPQEYNEVDDTTVAAKQPEKNGTVDTQEPHEYDYIDEKATLERSHVPNGTLPSSHTHIPPSQPPSYYNEYHEVPENILTPPTSTSSPLTPLHPPSEGCGGASSGMAMSPEGEYDNPSQVERTGTNPPPFKMFELPTHFEISSGSSRASAANGQPVHVPVRSLWKQTPSPRSSHYETPIDARQPAQSPWQHLSSGECASKTSKHT